jgi:hypothetical protein
MTRWNIPFRCALIVASLASLLPTTVIGQAVKVGPRKVTPNTIYLGSVSVSASPSTVNFALVAKGAATGNSPVNITTSYTAYLGSSSTISLYGYFTSASAALTGQLSSANIPSSAVFGQMTTGLPTTYTAFTQTNPFGGAGASLELFSWPVTILLTGSGSRTDALNLKIVLTSLPQLPADTYTGTLIIQAQAL